MMILPMHDESPVIAVLDDEAQMRKALRRLLRVRGYAVETFEDGPSLLAAFESRPFACVLLDLHMPGLDGFAILEALAQRAARPAVIVITGHDQPGNAERVGQLGAIAYLTKPVDEEPLMRAIESVVRSNPSGA